MSTAEPLVADVDLHVLVQVGLLGEAELAAREWTEVGSLVGVDAQVVEKVVPLSKHLVAAWALEDLAGFTALRCLELINVEVLSFRDMLFNAHSVEVEVGALNYDDLSARADSLSDVFDEMLLQVEVHFVSDFIGCVDPATSLDWGLS